MSNKTIKNRGLGGKVLDTINQYPKRTFSAEEMAPFVGMDDHLPVGNALSNLARQGKITRVGMNCFKAKAKSNESDDIMQTVLEMLLDKKAIKVQHLSAITEWTNATRKLLETIK